MLLLSYYIKLSVKHNRPFVVGDMEKVTVQQNFEKEQQLQKYNDDISKSHEHVSKDIVIFKTVIEICFEFI